MKKLSVLILTCISLAANNSLYAISPTKIFSTVKNKVTALLYQQEEVSKHEIKCTPSQKKVVIENANGNIKIKTWKQDGISIKMVNHAYSKDDLHKLTSSIDTSDNNTIFIKSKVPHNLVNNSSIDYELLIPQTFALRCSTGRGNINVKNCHGLIQATTDDGQIELYHTGAKACATTNNGSIIFHHASGPIQATANNGNIILQEVNNSACATASNGRVSMSSTAVLPNASIHLTSSGPIDLTLPKNSSANVLAKSKNGSVISDHLIKIKPHETKLNKNAWQDIKHNIEGTIGTGGKAEIILHAHNGSIRILEAEKKA